VVTSILVQMSKSASPYANDVTVPEEALLGLPEDDTINWASTFLLARVARVIRGWWPFMQTDMMDDDMCRLLMSELRSAVVGVVTVGLDDGECDDDGEAPAARPGRTEASGHPEPAPGGDRKQAESLRRIQPSG
jgi:hypothetical protein